MEDLRLPTWISCFDSSARAPDRSLPAASGNWRVRTASAVSTASSRFRGSSSVRISPTFQKPTAAAVEGKERVHADQDSGYPENCLLKLVRAQRWGDVVVRTQIGPSEARPLLIKESLCHETALGIFCESDLSALNIQGATLEIARALLQACPEQVRCSQVVAGHTPLRAGE